MLFIDTTDGPVVLVDSAARTMVSITGSVDDGWQTALEDVGPAGADKGEGGKYLILPPGYQGDVTLRPHRPALDTLRSYALLRSNLSGGSEADVAEAVAYGKRVKLYPLDEAGDAVDDFVDATDEMFDATIPYDVRFFEALDRCVQAEPWLMRDKAMIDQLHRSGSRRESASHRMKPTRRSSERSRRRTPGSTYSMRPLFAALLRGHSLGPSLSPGLVEGLQTDFADPDSTVDGFAG